MSPCRNLQPYLDREIEAGQRTIFEDHLDACESCRVQVEEWTAVAAALAEGARSRAASRPVTPGERQALLARARAARFEPRARSRPARFRVAVPAALAAMAAVATVTLWLASGEESPDAIDTVGEREQTPARTIAAAAAGSTAARVGPARLVLEPASRIEVWNESATGPEITLVRGRVALEVNRLEAGAAFVVVAGGFAIRVRGTVFAVSWDGRALGVDVADGTVEVSGQGGASWRVTRGQQLGVSAAKTARLDELPAGEIERMLGLFGKEPSEPAGEVDGNAAPSGGASGPAPVRSAGPEVGVGERSGGSGGLEELRGLVASGRFIEAEGRLEAHLAAHRSDTTAWSLLADCRRKSGRYSDAVAAYLELIDHAAGSEANLARYKAGVILQDRLGDHVAAVRVFGEFLRGSGGDALVPDAMLRAARSHAALGQDVPARALLERVVDQHAQHQAAAEARRLLEKLERGAEGSGRLEQLNQ
jgi:ferric-dicitrate binding protein FerR (iron transport regulator)